MHFTVEAQKFASSCLAEGSIAIDATCGNGFDTLFLSEQVGCTGVVYGMDIQVRAIEAVRQKLIDADRFNRCRLIADCHSKMKSHIDPIHAGRVSVAMFNLGYLPYGDKAIVTRSESTLAALDQALELVRPGGLISVLAYPGHAGGVEEAQCVADWVHNRGEQLAVKRFQDGNNSNSPILWVLTRI